MVELCLKLLFSLFKELLFCPPPIRVDDCHKCPLKVKLKKCGF